MEIDNLTSTINHGSFLELVADAKDAFIEERPVSSGRQFVVSLKPAVRGPELPLQEAQPKEYLLESAALLLKSGDFVLARNLYSFVLKKDLKDPEALKGLGTCLFRLGDINSARRCFKALRELFHKEDSILWLAHCSLAEKNDAAALELFRSITSPSFLAKEERYEFFKEMGNCHLRVGDFEQAEAAYVQALNLSPGNDATYINLGTLEVQRERFDLALFYFRRALQLNPSNSKAHCGVGIAALAANDLDRAREAFLKALDLDGLNVVALHQLAALSELLPIAKQVTARIQDYLRNEPKNRELRFALAALLYKQNEWAASEKELDEILKTEPGHLKAQRLKKELTLNRHRY